MSDLRIAHLTKSRPDSPKGEQRQIGLFSYPVPGLWWQTFTPPKRFKIDLREYKRQGFDAVVMEDGGIWGAFTHRGTIPVLYYVQDSTLSKPHYRDRLKQAEQADKVLVDHDRLERFPRSVRFSHCVNDRIFFPREKTFDVAFHMATGRISPARAELRTVLQLSMANTDYELRVAKLSVPLYAESFGHARIVVNLPQTPTNRPHRVLDSIACGALLITGKLPEVSDEGLEAAVHYQQFITFNQCFLLIQDALQNGQLEATAKRGYELVKARHTWAVRSQQLIDLVRGMK